ncbi:MAG: hypothetical protein HQL73_11875 [Magnetococcales bacterium]|nr:hypothetical protein [Magnetococcales bacterium]
MYCKYVYKASATQANILADVVAVLTGTSSVASLSSDCDKVNSVLITTVAAGWTVHDPSAGTNSQVLKAAFADDTATFKYLWISTNTSGYIITAIYETWNASTHTGTNLCYYSNNTTVSQRIVTSGSNILNVLATARYALFLSDTGAGYTNKGPSSGYCVSGVVERTREMSWDTPAAGYPPYLYFCWGGLSPAYAPRVKARGTGDLTGSSATMNLGPVYHSSLSNIETGFIPDAGGNQYALASSINVNRAGLSYNYASLFGNITSSCDIWVLPLSTYNTYDQVSMDGKTYLALPFNANDTGKILIRMA